MIGLRGISLKITTAIVFAVVATATALTILSTALITMTFRASLSQRSHETGQVINQSVLRQQVQLNVKVEVLAQNSQFQQDLQWQSADSLKAAVTELQKSTQALCAAAITIQKTVASEVLGTGCTQATLLDSLAVAKARQAVASVSTLESHPSGLLMISASPVVFSGQTIGFVVAASKFDKKVLASLKELTGAEFVLFHQGQALAGTTAIEGQALAGVESLVVSSTEAVPIEGLKGEGGRPLLAAALALRQDNKVQAVLVFALSAQQATNLRNRVTRAGLGLAILITLVSGLVGLLVARRISDPIVEIEQSFREIAASRDLSRRITKPYGDEVGKMASSFNQMQEQIESLHQRVVDAEKRMRSELQMASAVQEMLFPATSVEGLRCTFASHAQTSTEMGGDWYTIIHSPEENTSTVVVADVTGHGAASALVAAILHGFFNAVRPEVAQARGDTWEPTMRRLLVQLNQTIMESTHHALHLTLFVLMFDHRTMTVRYLNAGHLSPLLTHTIMGKLQVGIIPTPPTSVVGESEDPSFVGGQAQLAPGQTFIVYTDGLVECVNAEGRQYGLKRLRQFIERNAHLDERTLRDKILQDALAFMGEVPAEDDITFVVGRVR